MLFCISVLLCCNFASYCFVFLYCYVVVLFRIVLWEMYCLVVFCFVGDFSVFIFQLLLVLLCCVFFVYFIFWGGRGFLVLLHLGGWGMSLSHSREIGKTSTWNKLVHVFFWLYIMISKYNRFYTKNIQTFLPYRILPLYNYCPIYLGAGSRGRYPSR